MSVVKVTSNSGACLSNRALLSCCVSRTVRTLLIIALLPAVIFGKDIRLRNELIHTPDKSAKVQAAEKPAIAEAPAHGLFLIQFTNPINDTQRAELRNANVELLQAVPEDAFVARLKGASV